ncbi:MAG: hypothetical protein HY709_08725 [Candidatus Latescibacteria bacterium]|nr:hypothetical protein [Candidatus Latescibacterota bacterium]
MNYRERFVRTMRFQKVDRVPWWELWYWKDTLDRWHDEGLPEDVYLEQYFEVDRREGVGVNLGIIPVFEVETFEETPEYRIFRRADGVICQEFRDDDLKGRMPHWLEFPIKTKADWEEFKKRLNPSSPTRYPLWWEEKKRSWRGRDYPLSISAGSLYGWLRNWVGMENLAYLFYDDPHWIHEMMEYVTDFVCQVIERAVREVDIDYATLWEDMSYKTGSLISPEMVKKFMVPRYKRITELLRKNGIDIIFLDSDGNIEELIPLWLEAGINGVYPLEVAGGMDPVALRKKYGQDLLLIGGIDKRAMAEGREAIDRELNKLPYLCLSGGYIPWCDHLIPPDVSFENYVYYLERMKEITLDPEKYVRTSTH